jgi:hypothetical protein
MSGVLPFRPQLPTPGLVETQTYANIRFVLSDCHAHGRLAVIRTGVGMGKTRAAESYVAEHDRDVVHLTLGPTTRSVTPGLAALFTAVARLWEQVLHRHHAQPTYLSYPFAIQELIERLCEDILNARGRLLLIVDEAQYARPDLLDAFRHLHDRHLFGLVLAGNPRLFEPRRGRTETADFGALLSRAYHVLDVPAPTAGDVAAVADAYGITGADERALLSRSAAAGGLREMVQVIEKAHAVAAGPRVMLKHLKAAAGSTGLSAIDRGR